VVSDNRGMEVQLHELDPHGDVVLELDTRKDAITKDQDDLELEKIDAPGEQADASLDDRHEDEPERFKNTLLTEDMYGSTSQRALPKIRFRVSSRHLIIASRYFERRLKKCWPEGHTLHSQGYVEIPVTDCDPEAFLILLNIIHGHTRRVPRSLDVESLTKLAALVDYYECHEAVEVFSDMWIDRLKDNVAKSYSRDLIRWLCISWVFRKSEIFNNVTRIAQCESKGRIQQLGLPIPKHVIGKEYKCPIPYANHRAHFSSAAR